MIGYKRNRSESSISQEEIETKLLTPNSNNINNNNNEYDSDNQSIKDNFTLNPFDEKSETDKSENNNNRISGLNEGILSDSDENNSEIEENFDEINNEIPNKPTELNNFIKESKDNTFKHHNNDKNKKKNHKKKDDKKKHSKHSEKNKKQKSHSNDKNLKKNNNNDKKDKKKSSNNKHSSSSSKNNKNNKNPKSKSTNKKKSKSRRIPYRELTSKYQRVKRLEEKRRHSAGILYKTQKSLLTDLTDSSPKIGRNYYGQKVINRPKEENKDCTLFLHGLCCRKNCEHLHNYSLIYKKINNEIFRKNFCKIQKDYNILIEHFTEIFKDLTMDINFCIDCTGSMNAYIFSVKNNLKKIHDDIKNNFPFCNINFGFCGFRDVNEVRKYEVFDFTNNIDEIAGFIMTVRGYGGNDLPEDLTGGLEKSLSLNWGKNHAKLIIIITDAPCHGKKFWKPYDIKDDYENGVPGQKDPLFFIKQLALKGVKIFAIKIKYYTDLMYDIFSSIYSQYNFDKEGIVVCEEKTSNFGNLLPVIANNVLFNFVSNHWDLESKLKSFIESSNNFYNNNNNNNNKEIIDIYNSIKINNNSSLNNINNNKMEIEDEINLIESSEDEEENYDNTEENGSYFNINRLYSDFQKNNNVFQKKIRAICHNFQLKKNEYYNIDYINPIINHFKSETEISFDKIAFNKEKNMFYLFDFNYNLKLVAKKIEFNNNNNFIEEIQKNFFEKKVILDKICKEFNNRIINFLPKEFTNILFFPMQIFLYEIKDEKGKKNFYLTEEYKSVKYIKYYYNIGFNQNNTIEQCKICETFTHFSFQFSKGNLIINNLLGFAGLIKDCTIHCMNKEKFNYNINNNENNENNNNNNNDNNNNEENINNNKNLGYKGILNFFLNHNCNEYCKLLRLLHPKDLKIKSENFENYIYYIDNIREPMKNKEDKILKLCDICNKEFSIKLINEFEIKKKYEDFLCEQCDYKIKESYKSEECKKCKKSFQESEFLYKIKKIPFPKKCPNCKNEEILQEREEFYRKIFPTYIATPISDNNINNLNNNVSEENINTNNNNFNDNNNNNNLNAIENNNFNNNNLGEINNNNNNLNSNNINMDVVTGLIGENKQNEEFKEMSYGIPGENKPVEDYELNVDYTYNFD